MNKKSPYLDKNFEGLFWNLADNWLPILDLNEYKNKPITYLEIGTLYGANLLSVAALYGLHNETKLYCIDPWIDYKDYPEYKGKQNSIFQTFTNNIDASEHRDKITVIRGFSNEEVPPLENEFFDIIYIDGNHEPEYVLEDAVLSFRKLKKGGILIFDDYGWGGPDLTQRGIDAFVSGYYKKIKVLGFQGMQVFIKKLDI
jgi:predicted O-methyltransferase YrrM